MPEETGAPLWGDRERTRETLDRFFSEAVPPTRRQDIWAICVDMGEPVRLSLREHVPAPLPHHLAPGAPVATVAGLPEARL
jgi:hypothetical protein